MPNLTQSFSDFQFAPPVMSALNSMNFQVPTPIQQQTIPALLEGKDVLGLAQTGTGKTAAFALPLVQKLAKAKIGAAPLALIITPTRELALQVEQHIIALTKDMPKVQTLALCGGQSYTPQVRQLKKGCAIVVGTPGRILDHIRQNTLNLNQVEYFVLDEADEMLRMGFVEDVETIMAEIPNARQTALFSATMPSRIRQLVKNYLREPVVVEIQADKELMPKIEQFFLFASANQKAEALVKLLKISDEGAKIVFVRTKQQTEVLAEALAQAGLRAIALNGDLAQAMRERLIQQFRRGGADVLVATDIAARGLDVSQVTQVINYDMPGDCETYVHRIGRTGRAGRTGQSILFVEPKQARFLSMIERHTGQKIQKMNVPSHDFIQLHEQQQFLNLLKTKMQTNVSNDMRVAFEKMVEEESYDWQSLALHMVAMQLKQDAWVTHAHSPYDVSQDTSPSTKSRDFSQRPERRRDRGGDRFERRFEDRPARGFKNNSSQVMYRLAVGRSHGVRPGQIIGALANEGGIPGAQINGLKIYDEHATVMLPDDLSKRVVDGLKRAWVCGRQLQLKMQADKA
jgi:ATP-dependent RNA helicase DeaD